MQDSLASFKPRHLVSAERISRRSASSSLPWLRQSGGRAMADALRRAMERVNNPKGRGGGS